MRAPLIVLAACAGLAVPAAGQPPKLNPDAATLVKDNTAFALDLYRELAQKDGNLFFSPYSISTALAMTYAGARGETAAQMARTLHFSLGQDRLPPAFADLIRHLNAARGRKYQLVTANRLWGQKDYGFLPDFLKLTEVSYGAGLKQVDFIGATEQARKAINAWVEEQTKNKIKELIPPGVLIVDTRLVLTNAIYFKAAWQTPFNPKSTAPGPFHVAADRQVKVPLMHGSMQTNYTRTPTFEALELPYEQRDLSMVVLLPKEGTTLAAFEKGLTSESLSAVLRKLSDHQVQVSLPKFKVTAEFMLKPALAKMGMPLAFDRSRADFSGMSTQDRLYISHVIHKAFVDVNEAGTEAAASTAVVIKRESAPPPATFRANRPFVYLIRHNRTGSILFLGRVADPS